MSRTPLRLGITTLLEDKPELLRGLKVGLVSNQSAVDRWGTTSAELLHNSIGTRLCVLFGPEHGYFGIQTAREQTPHTQHPCWHIPIYSLYGLHQKPTPAMLRKLEVLVYDLPDIGARCYTYVSTLRYVMEACSAFNLRLIVADRPIPLPCSPDGPMLDSKFASFVAAVPTPMSYAMTPAETALYLKKTLDLKLDLHIAPMRGLSRGAWQRTGWPPWIPPSPGIRSWESATCYLATVFTEALPSVDCGRSSTLPFQLIGVPKLHWQKLIALLERIKPPGVYFHHYRYAPASGPFTGQIIDGVRLTVTDPSSFRPVFCSIAIIWALQCLLGYEHLWRSAREDWFDKLYGSDSVRLALKAGATPEVIRAEWQSELRRFNAVRRPCLLYPCL